jgi:hypothetical protein
MLDTLGAHMLVRSFVSSSSSSRLPTSRGVRLNLSIGLTLTPLLISHAAVL